MSLANRAKAPARAGSRQSLRLRASHGGGLGLRVSHRRNSDWRAPTKDTDSGDGDFFFSSRGASDDRHAQVSAGERKRRRKRKRKKQQR